NRLKKMLNVDKYDMALWDFSQFLRNFLKHGDGGKVRFKSYDECKEIVPDYRTMEYVRAMFYECLFRPGYVEWPLRIFCLVRHVHSGQFSGHETWRGNACYHVK
ncbi:MAG TPA: hypothetical protein GXX42_10310, partial [Petrimonas sp.]|uniref:hypothetical protein n=1 Tax=Petrimonas sp. TaxID=2023866 RepID=UPI001779BC0A|nr:hypothetical protein [Petrimonas sp.]